MRIPFLLNDLSRHIRYAFDLRARSAGVTRPQYRALIRIARAQGLTQSELADSLEVERITLGRMIDRMSAAGLVERRADPADRRVWRLHLLPPAHAILVELERIGAEVTAETLQHLSQPERDTLESLLGKLDDRLRGTRQRAAA